MTIYFQSGFETGDYSEWDAVDGPPIIDSAVKHDGNYSSRSEGDLVYAYRAEKDLSGVGLAFPYYIHGWVRVDEWLADDDILDHILGPKWTAGDPYAVGAVCAAIRRTAPDTYYWGLYDNWTFDWASTGVLLTLAKWLRIEMEILANKATLYLNGIAKCSVTDATIGSWDWLHAGAASTTGTVGAGSRKLWVDTILVDDVAPVPPVPVGRPLGSIRVGLRHMHR